MSTREDQIVEAIEKYLETETKRRFATSHPRSEFALSSGEEMRSFVLHDLWVILDRHEIPEELREFSIGELRWYWMKDASTEDRRMQGLIDTRLI